MAPEILYYIVDFGTILDWTYSTYVCLSICDKRLLDFIRLMAKESRAKCQALLVIVSILLSRADAETFEAPGNNKHNHALRQATDRGSMDHNKLYTPYFMPCTGNIDKKFDQCRRTGRIPKGAPKYPREDGEWHIDVQELNCFEKGYWSRWCEERRSTNSTSHAIWYWCPLNGCHRKLFIADFERLHAKCSDEEITWYWRVIGLWILSVVVLGGIVVCMDEWPLANYNVSVLGFWLSLFIFFIISSLALTECNEQYPFIVNECPQNPNPTSSPTRQPTFNPTHAPTPNPTPRPTQDPSKEPTPGPTVTNRPTSTIPPFLSRGLNFNGSIMAIIGCASLSILFVFSLCSLTYIYKKDTHKRKTHFLFAVVLAQVDIAMDLAFICFSEFAAPFLRLLCIVFLVLPCVVTVVIQRAEVASQMSMMFNALWRKLSSRMEKLGSRHGFEQNRLCDLRADYTSNYYHQDSRGLPFEHLHELILWTLGVIAHAVAAAVTLVVAILFAVGSFSWFLVCVLLSFPVYTIVLFFAVSSKGIGVELLSSAPSDGVEAARLFNRIMLVEMLCESIPQLALASLNEYALNSGEVGPLFTAQVISSSLLLIFELMPIHYQFMNDEANDEDEFWRTEAALGIADTIWSICERVM